MNDGEIVADASAVLAALKNERFDKFDSRRMVEASISAVNLCEVLSKLADDGLSEMQANAAVGVLDLRVYPFGRGEAGEAAGLRPHTRQAGLSLADRACLALAAKLRRPAVTADRAWAAIDVGIEIVLIR